MAYIQKRGDTWRVGWRENGSQHWSGAILSGEGAVEMKGLVERLGPEAALRILDQRQGRDTRTGPPLLRDWFERHLELLGAKATPGTIDGYRSLANHTWLPRLGDLPLDAISREAVTEWVAWQRKQETVTSVRRRAKAAAAGEPKPPKVTYSPKSIKNAHGLLSTTLTAAIEHHKGIVANVARGVGLPSDDAEQEMEIFTEAEWLAFIEAMEPHYRPLTVFLLTVGCRIGEATAVQVRDVDLARGTVRFRRAWKKGERGGVYLGSTKSKRGRRTVVLSPFVRAQLASIVEGKAADDLLFTTPSGGRVRAQHYRNRQWARALAVSGLTKRLTPHSLRHTGASWMLTDNVSPIVVQHRLGHESLNTTSKVYAHLLTDEQVSAAKVMERAHRLAEIEP